MELTTDFKVIKNIRSKPLLIKTFKIKQKDNNYLMNNKIIVEILISVLLLSLIMFLLNFEYYIILISAFILLVSDTLIVFFKLSFIQK